MRIGFLAYTDLINFGTEMATFLQIYTYITRAKSRKKSSFIFILSPTK